MITETFALIATSLTSALTATKTSFDLASKLRTIGQKDKISAQEVSEITVQLMDQIIEAKMANLNVKEAVAAAKQALDMAQRVNMVKTDFGTLPQVQPLEGSVDEPYLACPRCLPNNPWAALQRQKDRAACHTCNFQQLKPNLYEL